MGKLVEEFLRETQKSRFFEGTLKEADSQELYFREDPDSIEAYKIKEEGDAEVDVGCSLDTKGKHYNFVWRRSKSNDNISHGFSHYLTRWAYDDENRIVDGQKIGNKPVTIKTDDKNKGMLCSLKLDRFGYIDEERDIPEEVLLLVRQEKAQNGRIRLITCYGISSSKYIKLYIDNLFERRIYGSRRPDSLDKDDLSSGAMRITEKQEKIRAKTRAITEQAIEDYKFFLMNHFKKGYQVFQKIFA